MRSLTELLPKIKAALPPQYDCRLVDGYADKIEEFEPAHGGYVLPGAAVDGLVFYFSAADPTSGVVRVHRAAVQGRGLLLCDRGPAGLLPR